MNKTEAWRPLHKEDSVFHLLLLGLSTADNSSCEQGTHRFLLLPMTAVGGPKGAMDRKTSAPSCCRVLPPSILQCPPARLPPPPAILKALDFIMISLQDPLLSFYKLSGPVSRPSFAASPSSPTSFPPLSASLTTDALALLPALLFGSASNRIHTKSFSQVFKL